jgi:NitT/TauT family transport system permease protein
MQIRLPEPKSWIMPLLSAFLVMIVWECLVRAEVVRSVFLPAPSSVFKVFLTNIAYVLTSGLVTLRDIAAGYLAGCTFGVGIGILIGHYRKLNLTIAPLFLLISPIPIVTFLPLFIIWFGLNILPVLCCAFIAAFFPCLMNSISGVRNADHTLIEVGRNFGASDQQILWKIILPAAVPHIANGLRLSIQLCFLVTPVAEMIMGDIGLGGLIWKSADLFKTEMVIVGQLTLGIMGLILYRIFDVLERNLLLKWKFVSQA